MIKWIAVAMFSFGLAGCNSTPERAASIPPETSAPRQPGKPTEAQIFARNEWLSCLRRERGSASRSRAGAESALVACKRQEEALAGLLADDPTMTPAKARAGLEQVKANWRRGVLS